MKTSFTPERKKEITNEHKHFEKEHFPVTPQHSKYLSHFVFQTNKPTAVALAVRRYTLISVMISDLQCHVAPMFHTKLIPITSRIRRP